MRIGLLSQWYPPEPGPAALPGDLARALAARGHEVRVVTGFPNYPTGRLHEGYVVRRAEDEQRDGVSVRRVALYPSHDSSAARRVVNYGSFAASALLSGVVALRGVDALWVNYSPITVAVPMWAARYGLRTPVLTHVLDLWPDTMTASGFGPPGPARRGATAALGAWCRAMYASSAAVAYISPGVGPVLEARGVPRSRLHYAPMWADERTAHPATDELRSELGLRDDAVVLLYAGTIGAAQGLESLVDACARVRDPRFVCLVVGSGVGESALRQRAEASGTTNVRFLGRVPQARMPGLMGAADLSYVSLREHPLSRMTMPSKTQAALASGRALLVAAPGDVARIARDSGAGIVAEPDDAQSVADAIETACRLGRSALAEMGARGRIYYEREFSLEAGVDRVERILGEVARSGSRASTAQGRR